MMMIGKTAKSEQYGQRVANFSTRGSGSGVDLLCIGAGVKEEMNAEQEYESVKAHWQFLTRNSERVSEKLKDTLPYKQAEMLKEEKRRLGKEICDINLLLSSLRKRLKRLRGGPDLGEQIIAVCKERFTKPEWEIIMKRASDRYSFLVQQSPNNDQEAA